MLDDVTIAPGLPCVVASVGMLSRYQDGAGQYKKTDSSAMTMTARQGQRRLYSGKKARVRDQGQAPEPLSCSMMRSMTTTIVKSCGMPHYTWKATATDRALWCRRPTCHAGLRYYEGRGATPRGIR